MKWVNSASVKATVNYAEGSVGYRELCRKIELLSSEKWFFYWNSFNLKKGGAFLVETFT